MTNWPFKDISSEENDKVPFNLLFAVVVIAWPAIWVRAGFSIHKAIPADSKKAVTPQAAIHFFFIIELRIQKRENRTIQFSLYSTYGVEENQEIDDK